MTLDGAIKHAEEVAEENEKKAKEWHENQVRKCELFPFAEMDYTHEDECKKCANEHRQLAEWLKELKQLREQSRWTPVSEGMPKYIDYYLIQYSREVCGDEMAVAFYDVEEKRSDPDYEWEFRPTTHEYKEVVAWMPLPKMYHTGREE